METEIVKRPTTSAGRIAARRHRIRNDGRTNRVSCWKTRSYKKGLMMNRSRIWRRAGCPGGRRVKTVLSKQS